MIFKLTMSVLGLICLVSTGCRGQVRLTEHQKDVCVSDETDEEAEKRYLKGSHQLPKEIVCLGSPVTAKNYEVTSHFRDVGHSFRPGKHTGTDFRLKAGTKVLAVADGVVTYARASDHGTNRIIVDLGEGWKFTVLHLREIRVNKGDQVKKGQLIGLSGGEVGVPGSGPCTTGPHLHLAVHKNGLYADFENYLCASIY